MIQHKHLQIQQIHLVGSVVVDWELLDRAGAYYLAGGGGAGNYNGPSGPEGHAYGGAGGGGKGARSQPPTSFQTSGIMNTGSGGGGATTNEPQRGGQGGSGIVLLAYPT